jgi:hypothetical protein
MIYLETWIALASLGLSIMFVALMISFYFFLVGPAGNGPQVYSDPVALLIQLTSISGAPSLILAGIVPGIIRTHRATHSSIILICVGIIMIAGMIIVNTIIPKINEQYLLQGIKIMPSVFIIGGIGILVIGSYILTKPRWSKKYEFFE